MRRRNHYHNTPRWIKAHYQGKCHCGRSIRPGDLTLYFPIGKRLSCRTCGRINEMRIKDDELNAAIKAI